MIKAASHLGTWTLSRTGLSWAGEDCAPPLRGCGCGRDKSRTGQAAHFDLQQDVVQRRARHRFDRGQDGNSCTEGLWRSYARRVIPIAMRGSYKIIPGMKSANLITAVQTLERHLERRLVSARALGASEG